MRCLVAFDDSTVRDPVVAALACFEDVQVDAGSLEEGRGLLRRRKYDFAFIALQTAGKEPDAFFEDLRTLAPDLPCVTLVPRSALAVHRIDRQRYALFATLGLPLDAVELFGTVRRLLDRLTKGGSRSSSDGKLATRR